MRSKRGAFVAAALALALAGLLCSCNALRPKEYFRKHVQLHFGKLGHVVYCDGADLADLVFEGEGLDHRVVRQEPEYAEVDLRGAGTIVWKKNGIEMTPQAVLVNGVRLSSVTVLLAEDGSLTRGYIKTWEE